MSLVHDGSSKIKDLLSRPPKSSTILRDALGNIIREGMILFWRSIGITVEVKEINPGGIALPGGAKTPGEFVLTVRFPFDNGQPQAFLKDFIAVIDPKHDNPPLGGSGDAKIS